MCEDLCIGGADWEGHTPLPESGKCKLHRRAVETSQNRTVQSFTAHFGMWLFQGSNNKHSKPTVFCASDKSERAEYVAGVSRLHDTPLTQV